MTSHFSWVPLGPSSFFSYPSSGSSGIVGKVLVCVDFSACSLLKQKEPQIAYVADNLSLDLGFLGRFCPRGVQLSSWVLSFSPKVRLYPGLFLPFFVCFLNLYFLLCVFLFFSISGSEVVPLACQILLLPLFWPNPRGKNPSMPKNIC